MLPVIFSPRYTIRLLGIERLHPFDTYKYAKIQKHLRRALGVKASAFYQPQPVGREQLERIHTKRYLDSLKKSATFLEVAEVEMLKYIPAPLLDWAVLRPMRYATGGTLLGVEVAQKHGMAINLSGGYHHAKADRGEGFCFYADINLAIAKVQDENPEAKVLVVDLDAHQGNGHESIIGSRPNQFVFDIYNEDIYPQDVEAAAYIDFPFPISSFTDDPTYLELLKTELPPVLDRLAPDFVIYNAGSDIFAEDEVGQLSISEAGILERDHVVFQETQNRSIPCLMLLSGGYTAESAGIVGRSVEALLRAFFIPKNS